MAVLVVVVLLVGWLLPEKHKASRQATFQAPPEAVWALITDVEAFPSWRGDVKTVQRLPDRDGRPVWVEETEQRPHHAGGRAERAATPARAADRGSRAPVWRHVDVRNHAAANGSTLTITEDGEIYNPVFRVMARFVFGYEATMAGYLKAAEARLANAQPAR